jgi:hypothetical protein
MISKIINLGRKVVSKISNGVALATVACAALVSTAPAPQPAINHDATSAIVQIVQHVEQVQAVPHVSLSGGNGLAFLATIDLTDFTTALGEVGTAVTGALGDTVTAGLAISGVIMGGMLLWRLFRRIAKA